MIRIVRLLASLCLLLIFSYAGAHPSWGIAIDEDGNIYFADILHNGLGSVWKLSAEGQLELVLGNFHAHNVSLDQEGFLVVANGEEHQTMIRIKGANNYDTLITTHDYTEFNGGNCTYSPEGEVVFGIGNYLWTLDKNGNKEAIAGYKFGWNQTVYAAADGSFYAPDIGDGKGKLICINKEGTARIVATDLMQFNGRAYDRSSDVLLGIGQNETGDLFIADTAGKRIVRIDTSGNKHTYHQPGGDWFPTGITFHRGSAFILEFNGNTRNHGPRILKKDAEGNVSVIFDYRDYDL